MRPSRARGRGVGVGLDVLDVRAPVLVVVFGRDHRRAAGADPQRLEGAGHRVGGELAAAGAGAGTGDALELVQFLVAHVAGVVGADRLEDVEDGDVAAVPVSGGDRAAVEHHRGDVEPGQRHRAAGDRLVAGAEGDDRVELVAAGHQLDRVGDHLAADQRGLHPLGAHRHPVGDGDRVELHRRAAGGADALFDVLGETAQVEVAGHRLGPGVGDPDRRPAERLVVEADPLHVGARVGAVGPVEDGRGARAGELGLGAPFVLMGGNLLAESERRPAGRPPARRPRRCHGGRRRPPRRRSAARSSGFEGRVAERQAGGEDRGMGAAGAVRGASRMALALDRHDLARRRRRGRRSRSLWPPVTTTARGPSASTARASSSWVPPPPPRPAPAPRGCSASTTAASGSSRSTSAVAGPLVEQLAPLSATITGSITTGASPT